MNLALIIFLSAILFCFGLLIYRRRNDLKERQELTVDEPIQDEIVEVEFNGKFLYLAPQDLAAWKSLSNAQKQRVHMRQIELLRKGVLVRVTDENGKRGMITRNEAIAKGVIKQ